MALYKNKASQKIAVYAYDPTVAAGTDPSKTGDAAQISAQISKDAGTSAATDDLAPTELDAVDHPGIYIFDLLKAETNADMIMLSAASSTSNILLDPIQVFTVDEGFALSAGQIIPGKVEVTPTAATSTSFAAADITEATTDHYKNRTILWTGTSVLAGSVAQITGYSLVSGQGVFTVSTMQDTPSDNDTFVII